MVPGREIYARHYIGDTEVETTEADVAECHPHYKDLSLDERMEAIKADWIAEFGEPELEEEEIKLEAEPDTLDPFSNGETLTLAQLKLIGKDVANVSGLKKVPSAVSGIVAWCLYWQWAGSLDGDGSIQ
jgi:hypothetical protein